MSRDDRLLNRTNLVITLLIAAAASMSVASYSYSSYASDAVRKNALDEVHANAAGSAHNLSEILAVKMESVTTNLKFMSESARIREQQVPQSQNLFMTAQASTQNITDSYLWLDESGKILWSSSFANATLREQFAGADRSDRAYFAVPKEIRRPYITGVINSVDNNPRFYVSYPVLADDLQENFKGTVVASVQPISIGRFLQSKIAPQFQSTTGLLDKEGVILYSPGESQIGMNVFGDEYQSILPAPLRPQITEFFRQSLGGGSGLEDIEYQEASGTFAFSPVLVDGQQFATLYVSNLHTFSLKIAPIIDNQRNLSTIFIIAVSSLATVIVFIIFSSNRKLKRLVAERTDDLQRSNESLVESNKKLEDANSQLRSTTNFNKSLPKLRPMSCAPRFSRSSG